MKKPFFYLLVLALFVSCGEKSSTQGPEDPDTKEMSVLEEFIYETENALTPQCHASTIAATSQGLVAAWFGGTEEKNKDVGIWLSRHDGQFWSVPEEVVNGVESEEVRYPCWNPVLFQPEEGPLMLFYKVGPSPREWWGMLTISDDFGVTWTEPRRLPDSILGPIKNKPVQMSNGDLLCPTSTEHDGWKVHMERSSDLGQTWTRTGELNDGETFSAIQPTILFHSGDSLQILCRTQQGVISQSWSGDQGHTWSEMTATTLPNPNSGIDGITLSDGRHLLVYNPTGENWGNRVPLSLGISTDGINWKEIHQLEPVTDSATVEEEEYSYPSVIQTSDGLVHIVYTWNRRTVKHVVVNPGLI